MSKAVLARGVFAPVNLVVAILLALLFSVNAKELPGHVPKVVRQRLAVSSLEGTNELTLSFGLAPRDPEGLTNLLEQIYDPASPLFHRYIGPEEFARRFSPSEADYKKMVDFAAAKGLTVTSLHPNRTLLGVSGSAGQIEQALGIKLRVYQHPTEARLFFSTDREPTVPSSVPLRHVSGLNNFMLPHPMNLRIKDGASALGAKPRVGTGTGGTYQGLDFRKAYVPGSTLVGTGERVGLFELNGYYATDISMYVSGAGLTTVPLQNILIDNFNGSPGGRRPGSPNEEVALDIEMAISMAPGLDAVLVYEGAPTATTATINHILNRMATDNLAHQLSCSWGFDIDINTQEIFKQYAAQGQSFYLASGDSGAFTGVVLQPSDDPFVTVVGGTDLNTDSAQRWTSETVWDGSSGGISSVYHIPIWQQGIDMTLNRGSFAMRNVPDVAMIADNVLAIADRGRALPLSGTSIAAPLWAGFTALINEQATMEGKPPVGFVNPAIYALGQSAEYASAFHDITVGNNTNRASGGHFVATRGYDLCTGWGTPNGTNFISALLNLKVDPLRIDSPLGFTANGPVGGPFSVTSQTYTVTNLSGAPLDWQVVSTSAWLTVSSTGGSLAANGGTDLVTVSLNTNAARLLIGDYFATVVFQNRTSGASQVRRYLLTVGNGGFENGDLSDWTFVGDSDINFADSLDFSDYSGQSNIPGVDDSEFVHSGIYGAFLGQNGSVATLTQNLPTDPGKKYVLSFWLANPAEGAPNLFQAKWNNTVVYTQTDMPLTQWTNLLFVVTASSTNSVLQFGAQNDQNAFALDGVSVTQRVLVAPILASVTTSQNAIHLSWDTEAGLRYQLQSISIIDAPTWVNVGGAITATDIITSFDEQLDPAQPALFYRLAQVE